MDINLLLARNLDSVNDFTDLVVELATVFHLICDLVVAVKHCGVVSIAKDLANFWQ